MRDATRAHALTDRQAALLVALRAGPLTTPELVAQTTLTPGNAVTILGGLYARGLVEREWTTTGPQSVATWRWWLAEEMR